MSLFIKVQPTTLDEIVGNAVTVKALKAMLKQEMKPHVILLAGPKGCGKNTIAEILAKELGCTELGRNLYNGANTRGIDTIRGIVEEANLTSIGGGNKVFILDESHQLTSDAMEGLLDITNNPPKHCYFIFCTTDPKSIISTLKSRCTQYNVNPLGQFEIVELLNRVCKAEKLNVDVSLIEAISLTCEGSPRTALVSLEQILNITNVDEALELIVQGTERDATIIDLCKLLLQYPKLRMENWKRIMDTYSKIQGDNETVRHSILTFIYNKLLKTENMEDAKDLARLINTFSVSTYYSGKCGMGVLIIKACFGY